MRFLYIATLALLSSVTFAQNKISGTIKDTPFASVLLVGAQDTTQIASTFANDSGYYEFKRISKGKYFIQAKAMGFHLKNSNAFEITSSEDNITVPEIVLVPSSEFLDAVTIEAKRPIIELEAGKITMNINEGVLAKSENVFEMIRKFPGVSIDINDNISLNGKSGVLVTIDDRDPHLSGRNLAQYLRSMSGTSVQKIEAIDQPSAKYDAQGVSGIINIVTDRSSRNLGFSGSVGANLRVSERGKISYGADVSLNLQTKKAVFYGTLDFSQSEWTGYNSGEYNYPDGTQYLINKNADEKWKNKSTWDYFYGRTGVDFYLTKKDVLSLSYNGYGYLGGSNGSTFTYIKSPTEDSRNTQINKTKNVNQHHSLNLNYEHTFDTAVNSKIVVDLSWSGGRQRQNADNIISYYTNDTTYDTKYQILQPASSDIYSVKVDFEHPFKNKKSKLEAGLKGTFVINNNQQEYIQDGIIQGGNSLRYLYNEIIGAAYIQFKHTFSTKTSIEAGLRGEITYSSGHLSDTSLNYSKKPYARPFPSLTVSQEIDSKNKLSLSYRYRLTRPYFTQLNPFTFRDSENSYSEGNPELMPEYSHSVQLQYSYGFNLSVRATYSRSDGTPGNLTYFINNADNLNMPEHYTLSKTENIGHSDGFSLSLYTRQSFFKDKLSWSIFANGGYNVRTLNYINSTYRTDGFSGFVWSQLEVDFGKDWSGEISYWGNFPSKTNFSSARYIGGLDAGIKKMFLKKTLTVTLTFNNIIPQNYKWSMKNPDGSSYSMLNKWDSFGVYLSVSYRFGNDKVTKSQRQIQNEDSSRMGGGGSGSSGGGSQGGGK
ncbi:MAG: outer membrane beta-barrel protein [Bacteroidales bacterium]|jgi:hypothetical protein|nr:outer membrane beta-barrel protein [Bacteroidales bacterium]